MLKGVDLSKYQAETYKNIINDKTVDFVIARAAWRFSVDPVCDPIIQYAKVKNKKYGFYFFPLTDDSAPEQHAKWAVDQVKGYLNEGIPFLDWEDYATGHDVSNIQWAYNWLKEFERLTGVKPVIYMNSNTNQKYNFQEIANNDNGLWIANYGNNDGTDHGRPNVKYWKFAAIHQYTSNWWDKNIFYGTPEAWDLYAGKIEGIVSDKDISLKENYEKKIRELEERINELVVENKKSTADYSALKLRLEQIKTDYNKLKDLINL